MFSQSFLPMASINWTEDAIGIIGGCSIAIVAIITSVWYQFMRMYSVNRLKQAMIERGMSVEEIERVLAAKSSKN